MEPGDQQTVAGLDAETFKKVFRLHPAGVCVVAFDNDGEPAGFTATSVISVSADPAMLAFSIDSGSSNWPGLSRAETVAVSFLSAEQAEVSARFAARRTDRFTGGGWHRLPTGEPVIDGAAAWIRAAVASVAEAGRSRLVVLNALEAWHTGRPPLLYRDRTYVRLPVESDLQPIAQVNARQRLVSDAPADSGAESDTRLLPPTDPA
ncbi:flavin reductase (DIM6/NTAB) family NADH-FMN oxidoreductase RutF [Naumannella halotolerans]|uniref:Flavin reductase (DIM6/NTAB) family NADH-FMN oxidoreductase RutF n=2 Tax=Naumannella halotolerans TaxID=993414 RepID=A0A4R7J8N2_9ACTN|nr:flavin reductase (DIM6/NTAB) family NADH-FMN oxidoreductase RutF [Naumannella halotolerans]